MRPERSEYPAAGGEADEGGGLDGSAARGRDGAGGGAAIGERERSVSRAPAGPGRAITPPAGTGQGSRRILRGLVGAVGIFLLGWLISGFFFFFPSIAFDHIPYPCLLPHPAAIPHQLPPTPGGWIHQSGYRNGHTHFPCEEMGPRPAPLDSDRAGNSMWPGCTQSGFKDSECRDVKRLPSIQAAAQVHSRTETPDDANLKSGSGRGE